MPSGVAGVAAAAEVAEVVGAAEAEGVEAAELRLLLVLGIVPHLLGAIRAVGWLAYHSPALVLGCSMRLHSSSR
jgi:hypothetical protein